MNWNNITENAEVKKLLKEKMELESKIRAIEPNALIMHELELLSIPSVVDCKHENEAMFQGDGFVYAECADCGKDLY